jgi:hypothetical protein
MPTSWAYCRELRFSLRHFLPHLLSRLVRAKPDVNPLTQKLVPSSGDDRK